MIVALVYYVILLIINGFTCSFFFKKKQDDFWIQVLALGFLASTFQVLILGYLHLLYWHVFALASVGVFAAVLYTKKISFIAFIKKQPKPSNLIYIALILIFCLQFYVMAKGSYVYPYLENGDPWDHADGAKYVALEHTFLQKVAPGLVPIHYLTPYTPIYTATLGLAAQVGDPVLPDVMKLFNVFMICSTLLFAYLFIKERTNEKVGALSAAFLVMIPAFMSHFIWAQTLGILLTFIALYYVSRLKKDSSMTMKVIAALSVCSILITQPSNGAIFGILCLAYFGIELLLHYKKKKDHKYLKQLFTTLAAGVILSLVLFWLPMFLFYGFEFTGNHIAFLRKGMFEGGSSVDTSGGRIYTLSNFVFPAKAGAIDQQIGIGIGLTLLLVLSLIYYGMNFKKLKDKNTFYFFLFWLIFSILGVQGNALPVKLFPHRMWVYLAVPLCFFAAKFCIDVFESINKAKINKAIPYIFLLLILTGVWFTSFQYKYAVQTSMWPEHVIGVPQVSFFYGGLPIEHNTKFFFMCEPKIANGFGFYAPSWDNETRQLSKNFLNLSVGEIKEFLNREGYEYAAFDGSCLRGKNESALASYQERLGNTSLFTFFGSNSQQSAFIFSIVS